jgi:zinc and cadmium transporter
MLLTFCLLIVVASLVGGWLPSLIHLTHLRLQLILSAVAGLMLGVSALHLLPHSIHLLPSPEWAMVFLLAGILFMFFLNRMLHFHQHGTAETNTVETASPAHECDHAHAHAECPVLVPRDVSSLGLLVGMTIHTFLDGIALGAATAAHAGTHWSAAGFSVFLAIALHKPLDAMSVTSLMAARKWGSAEIALANIALALTAPLGAIVFYWGIGVPNAANEWIIGAALAFAAGTFLCISLGDLLPEVHFHKHDRLWLSTSLLLGIGTAVIVEVIPGHSHGAAPSAESQVSRPED